MTRKLSDIKLQDSHNGIPKGRVFQKDNKLKVTGVWDGTVDYMMDVCLKEHEGLKV